MAVIAENEYGWFICSKKYFDNVYSAEKFCWSDQSIIHRLKFRDVFFDIQTRFYTNSKSKKLAEIEKSKNSIKFKKTARTKKVISKNKAQDIETINFITKGTHEFVTSARKCKHLEDSQVTPEEWFENNGKARAAALEVMNHVDESLGLWPELICENYALFPVVKKLGADEYILPPQSSFHLCDITSFFSSLDEKYDLILMDPPWINKSVRRKNSYHSLKYDFLCNMPIEKLTNPGCLIVVWVTHSPSSAAFVLNELFPKCNITINSTWHWCKITKKGEFVHDIDSHHKKPYESLILGRVCYDERLNVRPAKEIDSKKLIVSVPSSIHSHKPPLIEILKPYLNQDAKCLELFARYLLPGWKSVGNEVLKLQNIKLFEPVSD